MTRPMARTTGAAVNPEYACDRCGGWHSGACTAAAHQQLGDLLARMVREADARIPVGRRARRTLQEMMPGFQRQPLLTLHRSAMTDDACPVCGYWRCRCSEAGAHTPVPDDAAQDPAPAPAPACASNGGGQCSVCGGWFEGWSGGVCSACS